MVALIPQRQQADYEPTIRRGNKFFPYLLLLPGLAWLGVCTFFTFINIVDEMGGKHSR